MIPGMHFRAMKLVLLTAWRPEAWPFWLAFLLLPWLGGCGSQQPPAVGENAEAAETASTAPRVVLSLAVSTREPIEEIVAAFQRETGIRVHLNAGGTSALAAQILAGAPADLFLSASRDWGNVVEQQGLVARSCDLLGNELVLIVPLGNPAGVRTPQALLSERVRRIALAGEKVPAGRYADQTLAALDLRQALAEKIVRGSDVRVALSYVERGEADAGIVYASDARVSSSVETVFRFGADGHDPIVYPLILLKSAEANPAAVRLYDYLQSESARQIFASYGFATAAFEADRRRSRILRSEGR